MADFAALISRGAPTLRLTLSICLSCSTEDSITKMLTDLKANADWMKERDVNMTQLMGMTVLFSASSSAAFLPSAK